MNTKGKKIYHINLFFGTLKMKTFFLLVLISLFTCFIASPESGYKVWLRYQPVTDQALSAEYLKYCNSVYATGKSEIIISALDEMNLAIKGMLGKEPVILSMAKKCCIIIGTIDKISPGIYNIPDNQLTTLNSEGFILKNTGSYLVITARTDIGLLYGTFHLLRLMQM
jgi:alpha-glucuronidase